MSMKCRIDDWWLCVCFVLPLMLPITAVLPSTLVVISVEFTSLVTHHLISLECNCSTFPLTYSWNMVYIIPMLM